MAPASSSRRGEPVAVEDQVSEPEPALAPGMRRRGAHRFLRRLSARKLILVACTGTNVTSNMCPITWVVYNQMRT